MSQTNTQMLAEIKGVLKEFQTHVDGQFRQTRENVQELFGRVRETSEASVRTATLIEAISERTRDDIGKLCDRVSDTEHRVSNIERDYKPRTACERDMAKVEGTQSEHGRTIVGLQRTEAKAMGIAAAVSVAISAATKWLWH
jgi:hypothetical protein